MFSSFNARALGLTVSAAAAIDLARTAGFEGVDLMVRDLVEAGDDPRELRQRLDDQGLRPGAWPLAIDWRDSTDARFRDDLDRLDRYAEAAALLGLTRTGTWVRPDVPIPPGGATGRALADAFEFHARRLAAIARVLRQSGIALGLEVLGVESLRTPGHPEFIPRLGEPRLGELLERLDADGCRVGLLVDLWHLFAAGETVDVVAARGMGRVVWVHVADLPAGAGDDRRGMVDSCRGLPGERGAIPIRADLERLHAGGYRGPVTVEPLGACPSLRGLAAADVARKAALALEAQWPRSAGVAPISGP